MNFLKKVDLSRKKRQVFELVKYLLQSVEGKIAIVRVDKRNDLFWEVCLHC